MKKRLPVFFLFSFLFAFHLFAPVICVAGSPDDDGPSDELYAIYDASFDDNDYFQISSCILLFVLLFEETHLTSSDLPDAQSVCYCKHEPLAKALHLYLEKRELRI